jgi:UDP-N-acetylmuramoyl-L-alanyl-D-glutamate--2,6-diaminopimelate ligase
MKLKRLIQDIPIQSTEGLLPDLEILGIASDSRQVRDKVLFVAVRGPLQDGHRYIDEALRRKAAAVILENRTFLPKDPSPVPYILVKDSKSVLNKLADVFFGYPYQHISCVGITGTNGKTTVSYLARSILKAAGIKCGLIGTIGYKVGEENRPLPNTTPGVLELHRLLNEMIDAGLTYVVMEVSSHALDQERARGIIFKSAIFTNLTQDHLDYHKNMEAYFRAKERLFCDHADGRTHFIINADDLFGQRLLAFLRGSVWSYGFLPEAKVRAASYNLSKEGSRLVIEGPGGELDIHTSLVGKHNLYNILAAVAFGMAEGIALTQIKKGIEEVLAVPGRLDRIDSKKGFSVFVDYAHTDDALKNVLESLRVILHNGRIITVFGCGGDRDKDKRPKMGRVACALSDYCIVTSDNPRSEDPAAIIRDISVGIDKKNFEIEIDRAAAIQKALKMAQKGDFVLVAGKGHETYQIAKNNLLRFNDKAVIMDLLEGF